MNTLYLDTNHLSSLAKSPGKPDVQKVLRLLEAGDATLCISILHLYELSHPRFKSRGQVGTLLDQLPLLWAISMNRLFDYEVYSAFERVLTGSAGPVKVFHKTVQDAWNAQEMESIPPSEMLSQFSTMPSTREKIPLLTRYAASMDRLVKDRAAALQSPDIPILARIKEMEIRRTPKGVILPTPYPAEELLLRAGGLAGFPAYHVFQALGCTRLADSRFSTEPNDIIDEWHACYSPYASVTVLDKGTVGRCRSAKLPHIDRITSRISDIEELFRLANTEPDS